MVGAYADAGVHCCADVDAGVFVYEQWISRGNIWHPVNRIPLI